LGESGLTDLVTALEVAVGQEFEVLSEFGMAELVYPVERLGRFVQEEFAVTGEVERFQYQSSKDRHLSSEPDSGMNWLD
jgi:hypothetical protein